MNIHKACITNLLLILAFLSTLAANSAVIAEEKVLNIYNWTEYVAPDTISNFEKETGIKVRYDTFETNEELNEKLIKGKSDYDIVVPSAEWAKLQISKGLFQKLDRSKLSNWNNLDPAILKQLEQFDPENSYLVNWLWGYTTIGVNVDKIVKTLGSEGIPENPWELVFNPKYTSKLKSCGITYLDSPSEILPAALVYIGRPSYSKNPDDYKAAQKMLATVRPDIKDFLNSSGQIEGLGNGSICIAIGWVGDFYQARTLSINNKTRQNIVALLPKSGARIFMDNMAIPASAKHPSNAHLFIDYILRPKVAASLTNAVSYANPNIAASEFIKPDIKNNQSIMLQANKIAKLITPDFLDPKTQKVLEDSFELFKKGQ